MVLLQESNFDTRPIEPDEITRKARVRRLLADRAFQPEIHKARRVVTNLSTIEGMPNGFYNAAAFVGPDGKTILVGRQVAQAGEYDQPDVGTLVAVTLDNGAVVETREIWAPENRDETDESAMPGDLIEDLRVAEKDGQIAFDVTRLSPLGGSYTPYPAFTDFVSPESLLADGLPSTTYLANVDPARYYMQPGKNTTRILPDHILYRPDNMDHGFVVHKIREDGSSEIVQELPFSEIPFWGKYRMGSTMPPVWLNENEAVLIIHGITFDQNMYRYTIGSARLYRREDGSFAIDNVSPNPHLTPEMFTELFPNEQVELHPELRQALYATGGVVHHSDTGTPQNIELFPNVGDTRTVSATLSIEDIVRTWK